MRTCPNCGQNVADDELFCANCGASVPPVESAPPAQDAPVFCPNCATRLPAGTMFCSNCGTPIPVTESAPPVQEAPTFCPNCGERLLEGAVFCSNCGTPIQSAQAPASPAPKKNTARIVGIAVVAAAAVAVVALVVWLGSTLFASPSKKFIAYHQDLIINMLLDGVEDVGDIYGSDNFSSTLTVTGEVDDPQINSYLEDSSIGLDLNLKSDSLVANGSLTLMGSEVLSGTVTYDKGQFGFQLPQVDNNYYVMDLDQIMSNLTGAETNFKDYQRPEISGKQLRSLIEAYLDIVYSTVNDKNVTVEKHQSVRLSGLNDSFTGTVYTFAPTADDIEQMINKLADHLENDKELRKLALQSLDSAYLAESVNGYYGDSRDPEEDLDEALLDAVDEMRDMAGQIGRNVERANFEWSLAVEGDNVRMIRLAVDGSSGVIYEAAGKSSDSRREMFSMVEYGEKTTLLEREYTKKGTSYKGSVSVTIPYEGSATLDFDLDTGSKSVFGIPYGTYNLNVPNSGTRVKLAVAAGKGGSADHTLTFDTDSYYGQFSYVKINVNATNSSSAKKPSQQPTNISDYSIWELQELFSDIGNTLQEDLMSNLSPSYYGW